VTYARIFWVFDAPWIYHKNLLTHNSCTNNKTIFVSHSKKVSFLNRTRRCTYLTVSLFSQSNVFINLNIWMETMATFLISFVSFFVCKFSFQKFQLLILNTASHLNTTRLFFFIWATEKNTLAPCAFSKMNVTTRNTYNGTTLLPLPLSLSLLCWTSS
jgi:hypothetical protein